MGVCFALAQALVREAKFNYTLKLSFCQSASEIGLR